MHHERLVSRCSLDFEFAQRATCPTIRVASEHLTTRGPVVLRVTSKQHGELSMRVEDVRGGPDDPFSAEESSEKFAECFRLGAKPLDNAQAALLTARVDSIETVADMSTFFQRIC